jgi:biopolymer transport protein ExbD/biopolymer transport protein TolR
MSISGGNGRQRQTFSEINITPLTDVFLVLLVIMLLLAPLLDNQAALKVDPPAAQTAKNNDPSKVKSILIEVSKDGVVAVNGNKVVEPDTPADQVQPKVYESLMNEAKSLAGEPQAAQTPEEAADAAKDKPTVKLKADNQVDYGRVVAVLDAVNKAQLGKLSLVTTVPINKPFQ